MFPISEVVLDNNNTTGQRFIDVKWDGVEFIYNANYITFYKNVGGNFITAVIPLVALGFLNYLVYKHLTKRRRRMSGLGKFFTVEI